MFNQVSALLASSVQFLWSHKRVALTTLLVTVAAAFSVLLLMIIWTGLWWQQMVFPGQLLQIIVSVALVVAVVPLATLFFALLLSHYLQAAFSGQENFFASLGAAAQYMLRGWRAVAAIMLLFLVYGAVAGLSWQVLPMSLKFVHTYFLEFFIALLALAALSFLAQAILAGRYGVGGMLSFVSQLFARWWHQLLLVTAAVALVHTVLRVVLQVLYISYYVEPVELVVLISWYAVMVNKLYAEDKNS